jgi:anti-sigma factor RsiW
MPDALPGNHAVADWVAGTLDPVQRQEFEAHLMTCADCQAQVSVLLAERLKPAPTVKVEAPAPPPPPAPRRIWPLVVAGALIVLVVGYFLGSWAWQMAH